MPSKGEAEGLRLKVTGRNVLISQSVLTGITLQRTPIFFHIHLADCALSRSVDEVSKSPRHVPSHRKFRCATAKLHARLMPQSEGVDSWAQRKLVYSCLFAPVSKLSLSFTAGLLDR